MQGQSQTAWKQNATIPIVFHESIAILLKNAPFFEAPRLFASRWRLNLSEEVASSAASQIAMNPPIAWLS